ncbi:MAG: hypothetical protein ABIQ39_02895 [Ilumatobacteraceae bacterium]
MAIRKSVKPVTITNEKGHPEIVLEINGLTLSMTPPSVTAPISGAAPPTEASGTESEAGGQG